jgi:hypothetical protein
MMKRKVISTIMAFNMVIAPTAIVSYAAEVSSDDPVVYEASTSLNSVSNNKISKSDVIAIEDDDLDKSRMSKIEQALDNGTDLIVDGTDSSKLEKLEDISNEDLDNPSENVVGYYVSSNGDEYDITPIVYVALESDGEELIESTDSAVINDLTSSEDMDYQQVAADAQTVEEGKLDALVEANDTYTLQEKCKNGKSYGDSSRFVYFYKKGVLGGVGTTYTYAKGSKDGWSKEGSVTLNLYAVSVKTNGKQTRDKFFAQNYFGGMNNRWLTEARVSMSVTDSSNNFIKAYAQPKNDLKSTYTLSTSAKCSDSDGLSLGSTSQSAIEYNPCEMTVVPTKEQYIVRWTCTPNANIKNYTYELDPYIIVDSKYGTTASYNVYTYLNHMYLRGGGRTYKMTTIGNAKVGLTIKNHKVTAKLCSDT